MNDEPILKLTDITYRYPDGTLALDNINLTILSGKKIAVLGGNGAGKSTLFLILNGIYKPQQGSLYFKQKKIKYRSDDLFDLRKNVGIVFQDPESQIFSAGVYEEISFGPLNLNLPKTQVTERVEQAITKLEIGHLQNKAIHHLSYGEKKRVSIAAIIAMEPEVVIFDEPTACLDPRQRKQTMKLIDEMNQAGHTIILSTHDVETAYTWADEIVVMKDGKIVKKDIPDNIFSDPVLLEETSLDKPLILEIYDFVKARQNK